MSQTSTPFSLLGDSFCVEGWIYLFGLVLDANGDFCGDEESFVLVYILLERRIQQIIAARTKNYIWNKEALHFEVLRSSHNVKHTCLHFACDIGSFCEADENFIASLMIEVTQTLPQVAVRLRDNDGDFLLMGAAERLPAWLTERRAEKRVWLVRGELCVVPQQIRTPTLADALAFVRNEGQPSPPSSCRISAAFQREALSGAMAAKGAQQTHTFNCIVPSAVVRLLLQNSAWSGVAVCGYFAMVQRLAMQPSQRNASVFPRWRHFVWNAADTGRIAVHFTRPHFAALCADETRDFCEAAARLPHRDSTAFRATALGMKLVAGLEFALTAASEARKAPVRRSEDADLHAKKRRFDAIFQASMPLFDGCNDEALIGDALRLFGGGMRRGACFLFADAAEFPEQRLLQAADSLDSQIKSSGECIFASAPMQRDSDDTWLWGSHDDSDNGVEKNADREAPSSQPDSQKADSFASLPRYKKLLSQAISRTQIAHEAIEDSFECSDASSSAGEDDDQSASCSDSPLSENEFEVLEAIFNDPDILMKIVEKNNAVGASSQNDLLLSQLKALKEMHVAAGGHQKDDSLCDTAAAASTSLDVAAIKSEETCFSSDDDEEEALCAWDIPKELRQKVQKVRQHASFPFEQAAQKEIEADAEPHADRAIDELSEKFAAFPHTFAYLKDRKAFEDVCND